MNPQKDSRLTPPSTDFSMLDYPCSYLPEKMVRMHYKYVIKPNQTFATAVAQRGWRRFGKYYFYPTCNGCDECKSLRINTKEFRPTKNQKKAIKRNNETKIMIQSPTLTTQHIDLYNKYHAFKQNSNSWKYRPISHREYYENFVEGSENFGKEVLYFYHEKLIGVDLIDILNDGISAIYCYYDPDYARLSIGTYSLLYQIALARQLRLPWIYLGYWVDGCQSFAYKTNFNPQEMLDGFPPLEAQPNWQTN